MKPVPNSGRFKVTSFIVIILNLEFNSMCRRKFFLVPLQYIDVKRSTYTDLDVMQEKSVDDLECRYEQKFVRFSERLHKIRSIGYDPRRSFCRPSP